MQTNIYRCSIFALAVVGLCSCGTAPDSADQTEVTTPITAENAASFEIDGVSIALTTPFLPGPLITSQPGDFLQMVTASAPRPFRELTLTAIPYGARATNESLPAAAPGGASIYEAELDRFRAGQGAEMDARGPVATMFGERIAGHVSVVPLHVSGRDPSPTLIVEWVAEAGNRLWILRLSRELEPGLGLASEEARAHLAGLTGLSVASATLDQPSTLGIGPLAVKHHGHTPTSDAVTPPSGLAPWWNGSDCDKAFFGASAYRLGGTYQNMPACGPLGTLVTRFFGAGGLPGSTHGELEWQCVELSMRYLRLRQNVNPYPANGSQVAGSYANDGYNPNGPNLELIFNGSAPPAPQPGDVLSYGSTATAGHTAVVKSVSVGSNGSGSITVLEQNNSAGGISTLSVSNWYVNGNAGAVTKWLVGDQDATPAVARYSNGWLAVFVRGRNNQLYYQTQNNFGTGVWTSLGGDIRGNPSVVQRTDGRLDVFARWSDGSLRHTWQTSANGPWTANWTSLGGNIQGSPVALVNGGGGVHVMVWNADNQLAYAWQTCNACGWSAVLPIGGQLTANPAAMLDASGRVTAFVRGITTEPWTLRQTAVGSSSWTNWKNLTGSLDSGIGVGKNSDGRLEVFVVGNNGVISHQWETCAACDTWSGWAGLYTNQWTRTPVVARNSNGTIEVFAVQLMTDSTYNNAPHHISQLNGWGGWTSLDGQLHVGLPAIGINADGRLEMFVRGDDRQLYHKWQTAANSMTWSGYAAMAGNWP